MIKRYLKHLIETAEENYLNNLYDGIRGLNVESMLDIGCYTGENTTKIAEICKAKKVYGIELNEDAIKVAREKGVDVYKQDINEEHWNIEDNSIDFVYSNQVIEHLYSVDNFIENIKRILKKDGYLLLSTENLSGWHNCFSLLMGYQPFSTTNICTKQWSLGNPLSMVLYGHHDPLMVHRAVFTYYALKKFLELYDFKIEKPINSGYYPLPNKIGNFFARLDRRHSVYIAFLVRNKK